MVTLLQRSTRILNRCLAAYPSIDLPLKKHPGPLITIAGVTGFLWPIITPLVSGLEIPIYDQPQMFPVPPAEGPVDPQVHVRIDSLDSPRERS